MQDKCEKTTKQGKTQNKQKNADTIQNKEGTQCKNIYSGAVCAQSL